MNEAKTESIRLNVTPAVRKQLEAVARREDVSVAHVIRQAIRLYLKKEGQ